MNKIALIIPYFGRWPNYLSLYFKSLANNPVIDLFLFTDITDKPPHPANVRMIPFTLDDFNTLASGKLGIPVQIERGYKICDFRPAYGLIFQEHILDYPFWAYGDLDLIYGNIEKCLPQDWASYDALSMRNEWMTGSLSIIRNTPAMIGLFQQSTSWQETFSDRKYLGLDECNRLFGPLLEQNEDKFIAADKNQSMTYLVRKGRRDGNLKASFHRTIKESIPKGDYVFYDHGRLTQQDGKELLHYHYITEKKTCRFKFPRWRSVPDQFYITEYGFFTHDEYHSARKHWITLGRQIRGSVLWLRSLPKRVIRKLEKISRQRKRA